MKLFGKTAILIFSIIGSTFFGALLFSDNLKQLEKRKFIASTIIFSIVWTIALNKFIEPFPIPFLKFAVINLIGGLILIGPIWNHHIGKDLEHKQRPVWGPLLSLIILIGVFLVATYLVQMK